MAERDLTYQDLLQILKIVEESDRFSDFHLRYGDVELELRKHGSQPLSLTRANASESATHSEFEVSSKAAHPTPPAAQPSPAKTTEQLELSADMVIVKSPMVGTFYRSPEPGAPPFVIEGQKVDKDSTVCILEVMKLMNSIPAGAAGVVAKILVSDGEAVEFGQPLIAIDTKI